MSLGKVLDEFQPEKTIYLPGATGEILSLIDELRADPDRMNSVNAISCLLPGMNSFDYAGLHEHAHLTSFLFPPESRDSFRAGRVTVVPLPYLRIAEYFSSSGTLDVAIAHVAIPASGQGMSASTGIAADFTDIAWQAARRKVAIVNTAMPHVLRGSRIDLTEADLVVETDSPLVEVPPAKPDKIGTAIAQLAAELIPDGARLQIGIGSAPAALWKALASRKQLRLRSGLAGEDFLALADAGAIANDGHVAGIMVGTARFYNDIAARDLVRMANTFETHDYRQIGSEERFFAANSALSVDLLGQVNLEWQGNRPLSGVGGAPDFATAAIASSGGRNITMLPSTAARGSISRIVPCLNSPSVSLPRHMADLVITEYGIADLRDKSLDARADALIGIADPAFHKELADGWRELRKQMFA